MSLYGVLAAARTLSYYARKSYVVQNNLANQSTDGYKFDRIIGAYDPATGTPAMNRSVDLTQGSLEVTGNPFDLSLEGAGFFVIDTPAGERLTRNGAFGLNTERVLVDAANRPVLGQEGPLTIHGDQVEVQVDGVVMVDGEKVDRLRIVNVANPERMAKEGISLLVPNGPLTDVSVNDTKVRQYGLEQSNVKPIEGMSDMITIQRNFALNMSALTKMDSMLETVTNNLGRV
jgi:flagellar basal-body rod protein FlgG